MRVTASDTALIALCGECGGSFFRPVSPGTWPGGAWVPWWAAPCFCLCLC